MKKFNVAVIVALSLALVSFFAVKNNEGILKVSAEGTEQQEAQHLEWCDSIYHQNVGCPEHGKVDIPVEVLEQQEAQHLEWCDSIHHKNVSCPQFEESKSV